MQLRGQLKGHGGTSVEHMFVLRATAKVNAHHCMVSRPNHRRRLSVRLAHHYGD